MGLYAAASKVAASVPSTSLITAKAVAAKAALPVLGATAGIALAAGGAYLAYSYFYS